MKYKELLTLKANLTDIAALRDKDIRVEFKLFLTRNIRALKDGQEDFDKLKEESEEYKEYLRKLNAVRAEYIKKDDAGEPAKDENGNQLYEDGLRAEREALEEEYKEAIDNRKKDIDDLQILLDKPVIPEPKLHKIEKKYVPFKVLTANEVELIYDYIIFPEDKKEDNKEDYGYDDDLAK